MESYIFVRDLFEGEKISKMRFNDFVNRVPSDKKWNSIISLFSLIL